MKPVTPFKYANLSRAVQAKPDKYLNYGPWWWSVKAILKARGLLRGDNDDSRVREIQDAAAGGEERAILRCALSYYNARLGTYQDGLCRLENGEDYLLVDPDAYEQAILA